MGNACGPFGNNQDEGMRAFAIVEMGLAAVHILGASYVYTYIIEQVAFYSIRQRWFDKAVFWIGVSFIVTLVFHAFFSFLLYLKGWKERNSIICIIWCVFALASVLLSFMIASIEMIFSTVVFYWTRFFFYLVYVFYGVWIVICFIKWMKINGIKTEKMICICCNPNPTDLEAPVPVEDNKDPQDAPEKTGPDPDEDNNEVKPEQSSLAVNAQKGSKWRVLKSTIHVTDIKPS